MRRIVFFTAWIVLAFVSCKRDYHCQCEENNGDSSYVVSDTTIHGTKNDAEGTCEFSVTAGGKTTTCYIVE